jgi:hypothetical protein
MSAFAALFVTGVMICGSVFACPTPHSDERVVESESLTFVYRFSPTSPRIGQPFDLGVRVCDQAGTDFAGRLTATAVMPAHGHGMNYRLEPSTLQAGASTLRGFLFHMPGRWELTLVIESETKTERVRFEYVITP